MLQSRWLTTPEEYAMQIPYEYFDAIVTGELFAAEIIDVVGGRENTFGFYVADTYDDWSELVWFNVCDESLETVATLHPDDERYTASIETLKSLDMESVDIIAVMYDSTDYENGMPIANLQYEDELTTYTGAMRNAFKLIQEAYPYIRIVFLSPTYMLHENEDGSVSDGRTTDLGNGTLIQYWQWAFDTCAECSVSFLDNYYGSVNDSNYTEYLSDHMHLNEAGRTKVADHFVYKVLMEEYSEYDANALAVAEE